MISLLQLAYVIALRRAISTWKLEIVLFLGMILAVSLMSSGVIFSDLLEEAALRRTLDQATPEQADGQSQQPPNGEDDGERKGAADDATEDGVEHEPCSATLATC